MLSHVLVNLNITLLLLFTVKSWQFITCLLLLAVSASFLTSSLRVLPKKEGFILLLWVGTAFFIHSFIHSFVHSFIHSFIHAVHCSKVLPFWDTDVSPISQQPLHGIPHNFDSK